MSDTATKECPFCAETIQAAARFCRFCGRELPGAAAPRPDLAPAGQATDLSPALPQTEIFDLLASLVQKSLVVYEEDEQGCGRYRLLETVRQYARDRLLETETGEAIRDRHQAFFLALAEQAEPELQSPEQAEWLDRLEQERGNLRAALEPPRADQRSGARSGARAGVRGGVDGGAGDGAGGNGGLCTGRAILIAACAVCYPPAPAFGRTSNACRDR